MKRFTENAIRCIEIFSSESESGSRINRHSMNMNEFVNERVRGYYWDRDLNCATTTLLVLSEHFEITIENQVLDAAIGMHGAGGYQAQCGVVEGTLMFIGILGRAMLFPDKEIVAFCKNFAQDFESEFKSLRCKLLRPEGFKADNPPHLCEALTVNALSYDISLISKWLTKSKHKSRHTPS